MSRNKKPKGRPKKKAVRKSTVPRKPDGSIDWRRYNEALKERGRITFWIEKEIVEGWREDDPDVRARGGQRVYSDVAIRCVLTIRSVFHLALRQSESLCRSLLGEMGYDLPTPDFTTLSRRCRGLDVPLPRSLPKGALDIVVDSTGIKVYGEGEWKVRQHGISKRRTWLKLHLALDVKTQEVCAGVVSSANVSDDEAFGPLMDQIDDDLATVGGPLAGTVPMTKPRYARRLKSVGPIPAFLHVVMPSFRRSRRHLRNASALLISGTKPSVVSDNYARPKPRAI